MVNTGKPSSGCGTCRARRIKCDERHPSCFRCQKSKRVCSGYRDPDFIRMSGLKRKKAPHPLKQTTSDDGFAVQLFREEYYHSSVSPEYDYHVANSSPTFCLSTSIDDQAFCYFLKNFVLSPCKGNSRSYMSFVVPVMEEEKANGFASSTLSSAVKATSLALLSNRPNSRSLQPRAARQYSKALKEVNNALQSPELVLEDETLAAVIILGVFEALTSTGQPNGWLSHAKGAASLVKARDEKKETSDLGRVLHVMVRSQMVINCFLCCTEPPLGVDWWMQFGTKDGIPSTCAKLCLETVELHAIINRILANATQSTDDLEKVMGLLKSANVLDSKFEEWEVALPKIWQSFTAAWSEGTDEPPETVNVFPGRVDKYFDISIATARNVTRAARVVLAGDIVRVRAWLCPPYQDYKTTDEYLSSIQTARQLIEDMVASVPYFLGKVPVTEVLSPTAEGLFGTSSLAMFVTWPLFVIAASDFTTEEQRLWARGRLNFVAEEKGIGQASLFAVLNVRIPSMSIYKDNVSKLDGKEVAVSKCMELALNSCGETGSRKHEVITTVRGILGLSPADTRVETGSRKHESSKC